MRYCIGMKQTTKIVEQGLAIQVIIARDTDPRMIERIVHLCERMSVPVVWSDTMRELGEQLKIDVGAAMAALVADEE
ncbi:ribosomal L7Ae/L30e/S12e/Gadd45 family protein [Paenibacillus sp. GCM10023252]|uniref:ribosomal L7Ae/L30e/S12e/Gadd45 family protein n=1 Tax=Paenibacillus sp. GCM10023252 TaxID=3252649 RepID=UPI0036065BD6